MIDIPLLIGFLGILSLWFGPFVHDELRYQVERVKARRR